jgi:beta-glucosidase
MYVAHQDSKIERPMEELKGYKRIRLEPGKKTTVVLSLKASDLAYWNVAKGAWDVEADQVSVMIGSSSADIKLKKTLSVQESFP